MTEQRQRKESSGESLDEKRQIQTAYEYLCHLEETKIWLEHHLHIELPESSALEESLRNGVTLALLGNFIAPDFLPLKKIFDLDLEKYNKSGIVFKHTQNIVNFFDVLKHLGFPNVFYPETTDIYDMKNMPKCIYCIHALSVYLTKLGKATPIQNLMGKVEFSDADILKVAESLKKYGIQMPAFSRINGILASELSEDDAALHAAILLINEALETDDNNLLLDRLRNLSARLYGVYETSIVEYAIHLKKMQQAKKRRSSVSSAPLPENEEVYDRNLCQREIQSCLNDVNIIKCLQTLSQAARNKDERMVTECLISQDLGLKGVLFDNNDLYVKYFSKHIAAEDSSYTFDLETVNSLIAKCNLEAHKRNNIYSFVSSLNQNMSELTPEKLKEFLTKFEIKLKEEFLDMDSGVQWLKHLYERKVKSTGDNSIGLWFDDVNDVVIDCNKAWLEATQLVVGVEAVNKLVIDSGASSLPVDKDHLYDMLLGLGISGMTPDCKSGYAEAVVEFVNARNLDQWDGWCENRLNSTQKVFHYNYHDKAILWYDFPTLVPGHGYASQNDLQSIVNRVTEGHDREIYLKANESKVVIIQALIRTRQTQKMFAQRHHLLILQSYIRTRRISSSFHEMRRFHEQNIEQVNLIQQVLLCVSACRRMNDKLSVYRQNADKVIIIQSVIRALFSKQNYNNLVHADNPSYTAVCKFVRLLDLDANDMREENELLRLKSAVLDTIKVVNVKEAENREIDVKIGLLVKNKLKVDEVLAGSSSRRSRRPDFSLTTITKEQQVLIDQFGKLLYILQTKPEYMSNMILQYIGNRGSTFIKETCYSIFNYGTNIRDEFTIIKMFACALELEVEHKIYSIQDFIKGDPLIIKMVVNFYRNAKAQTWLEEMISSCVKDVVANRYNINTSPVEIYKQWINQMETETGQASGYPYDVDTEKAMSYDEVKKRLAANINNMKEICEQFVAAIVDSHNSIPYGIRYVCGTLRQALQKKFPNADPIEYLKVISNVVYYRTINPAIVSPDSFNMMSSAEISAEKRKNLAAISAVIQRVASHNFSKENVENNMFSLYDFMSSSWERMQRFLINCTTVEPLGQHFNIDEYTDTTAFANPELHLPVEQVYEIHKNVNALVEESQLPETDPVAMIMKEIGELPEPKNFIDTHKGSAGSTHDQLDEAALETIVTFTLYPPQVVENDDTNNQKLLLQTIRHVVDLMTYDSNDNLGVVLRKNYTSAQEREFSQLMDQRYCLQSELKADAPTAANPTSNPDPSSPPEQQPTSEQNQNDLIEHNRSIKERQQIILKNAEKLEELGLVHIDQDYTDLVKAVAKEIRNRRNYRKNRKFDLLRLRTAFDNLKAKENYLDEQKEFYKQYVNACVANLNRGNKNKSKSKKKIVVKYNASELHKQGVVLEVEGLTPSQFKNVQFEISSTDDPGAFTVNAKVFGVRMDSTNLVFEELLQHQYENTTAFIMFGRAKVNVNLLIHILNKKFYSKRR